MDAVKLQRICRSMIEKHIPFIPGIIYKYIHIRYSSDLGTKSFFGKGTRLGHGGIGVVVNNLSYVGRNCILAQNVTLASKDGEAPHLGDYVYVGANSVILGGVKIGNNAFIGALSFVNKDVPENAIVIGSPARILRYRTYEEIQDWHRWVIKQGGIKLDDETDSYNL